MQQCRLQCKDLGSLGDVFAVERAALGRYLPTATFLECGLDGRGFFLGGEIEFVAAVRRRVGQVQHTVVVVVAVDVCQAVGLKHRQDDKHRSCRKLV